MIKFTVGDIVRVMRPGVDKTSWVGEILRTSESHPFDILMRAGGYSVRPLTSDVPNDVDLAEDDHLVWSNRYMTLISPLEALADI